LFVYGDHSSPPDATHVDFLARCLGRADLAGRSGSAKCAKVGLENWPRDAGAKGRSCVPAFFASAVAPVEEAADDVRDMGFAAFARSFCSVITACAPSPRG